MTQEKIISALNIIKEVCQWNDCVSCPFNIKNRCGIVETDPSGWRIKEPDQFKAFKE